jgi:hypothetical protein
MKEKRMTHAGWKSFPGSALAAIGLVVSDGAASAAPVSLNCTYVGAPNIAMYISIDYGANTVVTSDVNVTTPMADSAGNTAQPAQVTDSQIVWKIVTKRALGGFYAQHFTLNRLSGTLGSWDDGTQHADSWTCQVGAKPVPKF